MTRIFIPKDVAALAVGADKVAARILAEAQLRGQAVEIVRTGSRGMFFLEPLVEIETEQGRIAMARSKRPMSPRCLMRALLPETPIGSA